MENRESAALRLLDWDAVRSDAQEAARDFLENRWEAYLAMIEKVEAQPGNQQGADKTLVERGLEICCLHQQAMRRAR